MIRITKGQPVEGDETLSVISDSGDYEDTALIECAGAASTAVVYQAQYIKYGQLVYQHSDPVALGTEILKLDPESTHTAAAYVRMTKELLSQMQDGSLEPESLDQAIEQEQEAMEDKRSETTEESSEVEPEEPAPVDTSEPEEPIIPPVSDDTSTTTPATLDVEPATSTPEVLDIPEEATTTPDVVLARKKKLAQRTVRRA